MLDDTIFNERPESQDRAIDQLRSMGYVYVSPAEAEVKRGHLSKVLFKDELRRFLSSQNFTYRNKITAFADSTIGKAIEDLDIPLQNGLLPASKTIYDTLLLGRSYEEQLFDGGKQSFDLNFIDWEHPEKNIWQVTEEFSVERDNGRYARPDIVILLNGIPVVVIECKRSGVDVTEGIKQNIRNWHPDYIPHLFKFAQLVIVMNPNDVRYGTCGTPAEFFTKWQEEDSIWQENEVKKHIKGKSFTNQDRAIISLLSPERLLKLIRYYVFYDNGLKKIARYQQFFGVENIMRRITGEDKKDSRGGFIWHTQGSGKSLTMVMLTKRILAEKNMRNYRFVLVCDRVNLIKQLRASSVGNIVDGRELVFEPVACPVADGFESHVHKTVMGKRSGPHDIRSGLIGIGLLKGYLRVSDYGFQQAGGYLVGEVELRSVVEEALKGVHHDIGAAASGLVSGDRVGELGVHEGEHGAAEIGVASEFVVGCDLVACDDAGVAHLASGGGQCENHTHRGTCLRYGLSAVEVPDISVIGDTVGNALGAVDHRAAADRKNEIHILFPADFDSLSGKAQTRIRLYSA